MKRVVIGFAWLVAACVAVLFNHGLRGCASPTLGRPEERQALAQPTRVIRGSTTIP